MTIEIDTNKESVERDARSMTALSEHIFACFRADRVDAENTRRVGDMLLALCAERDQALAREAALKDNTQHCRELQLEVNSLKAQLDGQKSRVESLKATLARIDQIAAQADAAPLCMGEIRQLIAMSRKALEADT